MQNRNDTDIRCGACSRKLGQGQFTRLQIKCPRCGTLNFLRAESPPRERPASATCPMNNEQNANTGAGA